LRPFFYSYQPDGTITGFADQCRKWGRRSPLPVITYLRIRGLKAIGVDIIETERIEHAIQKTGDRFLERVFTPGEIRHCKGRIPSLAARWAAKEAMGKAFGTGIGPMAFKEIEIICNERGKPGIVLHGQARVMANQLGFTKIEVSLSHTQAYAVAFIVVE
jgi:holo-[acyl-carrier protein] synthase